MTRNGGNTWQEADFTRNVLPPACQTNQLSLSQPGGTEAGLSNTATGIELTNISDSTCTLDAGYPGVTLHDSSGAIIPINYSRQTGSYIVTAARDIEPVLMASGGTATFFLSGTDNPADNQPTCPTATRATIYPPGDTTTLTGPVHLSPCRNELIISPVSATNLSY